MSDSRCDEVPGHDPQVFVARGPRGPYRKSSGGPKLTAVGSAMADSQFATCLLLAEKDAPWSEVWNFPDSNELRAALSVKVFRTLKAPVLSEIDACLANEPGSCLLLGAILVNAWEFSDGADVAAIGEGALFQMATFLRGQRYRTAQCCFASHSVVDVALLETPVICPAEIFRRPNFSIMHHEDLLAETAVGSSKARPPAGSVLPNPDQCLTLHDVLSSWKSRYCLAHDELALPSFLDPRLSLLLLNRAWPLVAFSVVPREKVRLRLHANLPPREAELRFLASRQDSRKRRRDPEFADSDLELGDTDLLCQRKRKRPGCIESFAPHHLVRALRLDQHLKASGRIDSASADALGFLFPAEKAAAVQEFLHEGDIDLPGPTTLRRARVRFDLACMLAARRYTTHLPFLSRYICFDKSPQKEEIIVLVEDVVEKRKGEEAVRRLTPLSAMGYRHCGILHVGFCLVHKVFLEAGPSREGLESWFSSVRSVLTDHSSVEANVAELRNIIPAYLRGETPSSVRFACEGLLFPNAMRVIGVNHTMDTVLVSVLSQIPFFPAFQTAAKTLCGFLSNRGYRTSLVLRAGGKMSGPRSHSLSSFSAKFAHWRWGTLRQVCKELERVGSSLLSSWDIELFRNSKGTRIDDVDDVVASGAFWDQLTIVKIVLESLESFRTWCQACPCHEAECLRHAKKGSTFSCQMKSRRGPELAVQLEARYATWRGTAASTACPSAELHDALRNALAAAEGHCRRKFGYLSELPWLLWGVRESREVAQKCIGDFDDSLAAGVQPHRVSARFLSPGSLLRSAFEEFARGCELSEALSDELREYELAPLDETPAEAGHRDVTRIRSHAASSELAWWASSTRLKQNLCLYSDLIKRGLHDEFAQMWHGYKSVLQKKIALADRLQNVKLPRHTFTQKVYLTAGYAYTDLSWVANSRPPLSAAARRRWRDGLTKHEKATVEVRADFATRTLQDGCFFSVQKAMDADAGPPDNLPQPEAVFSTFDGWSVFKVIMVKGWKSRVVGSDAAPSFQCGVMMQPYAVRARRCLGGSEALDVFPFGDVGVVDALSLAPWSDFVNSLRSWSSVEIHDDGTATLANPRKAQSAHTDQSSDTYPSFLLIGRMLSLGWKATLGSAVPPYSPGGSKLFEYPRCVSRRWYLRCCLSAESLFQKGLPALPHSGSDSFYKELFSSTTPGSVELESFSRKAPRRRRRSDAADDTSSASASFDSEVPVYGTDLGDDEVPLLPRQRRSRVSHHSPVSLDLDIAQDLAPAPAPVAAPRGANAHGPLAVDPAHAAADSDNEFPLVSDRFAFGGKEFKALVTRLPEQVEGMTLQYDDHQDVDPRKSYLRLGVSCPQAGAGCSHYARNPCHRYRNMMPNQMKVFGQLEPLGFLGAWLCKTDACDSKTTHMKVKPSDNEICEYLVSRGYIVECQ